ncbi:MAG TPA: cell envelope biogenesis protein OmpA, partial [Aliiroseovarius sp.]|nr:cell envelope biogenesis protein OmpA [Aliiroseovarius sp.]
MNVWRAAVFAALFSMTSAGAVLADDVTLSSRDGSIELSGDLLGYDGEYYRIETEYGILTVDGSGVVCDGPGCPNLGNYVADVTLAGAREMGSVLMPALVEGFALRRGYALAREELPGEGLKYTLYEGGEGGIRTAEFTIRQTSNAEGFADLLGQQADIALAMREVTRAERRMGLEAGLGDLRNARQARVLALDALVPVVSPGNPVRRLTMDQLVAIYAGQIENWAEVGGEDAPITAYLLRDSEGFSDVFDRRVMAGVQLSDEVLRQPTNSDLIHAISEDPFGIGISTFSQPGNTEIVTLSGECGYELAANPQSIRAEDYPLTAPLFIYL